MPKWFSYAVAFPFVMALLVPSWLYSAFAVMTLWEWFVVPLEVQPLTLAHAAGFVMFVTLFRIKGYEKNDSGDIFKPLRDLAWKFFAVTVTLGFGYAAHLFM